MKADAGFRSERPVAHPWSVIADGGTVTDAWLLEEGADVYRGSARSSSGLA
jgi:hypothetical protein